MGHNISRDRLAREALTRSVADLQELIVPGWRLDLTSMRAVMEPTILGALRRREKILVRCQREDCRRRVELDLESAVRSGYGDKPVETIVMRLRCDHWQGCRVKAEEPLYPMGVPLIWFVGRDVQISVTCAKCRRRNLLPPKDAIRRLRASRRGDGATGIVELAGLIRGPCRGCGGYGPFETGTESLTRWPA